MYSSQRGEPSNGMFSVRYERVFVGGEEFPVNHDSFLGSVLGIYCSKTGGGLEMDRSPELVWNSEQHALEDGEVVAKVIGAIGLTLRDSKGDNLGGSKKPHLEIPFEFTTTVNLKNLQAQVQANGLTEFFSRVDP